MSLTNEQMESIKDRAGVHSTSSVPVNDEQRLYFGMLEILDYECVKYEDAPAGITEEDIKEYLIVHKDSITCEPSSYLGVLGGRFDFLYSGETENAI